MKLLSRAILISLATCTTHLAVANDYQSFTSINYNSTSTGAVDNDSYGIGSTYYFDKKSSLGPLNEFDYINTVSNVSASYRSGDYSDSYNVSGEYFVNNFLISAGYSRFDLDNSGAEDSYNLGLGYLISDNFLVKVNAEKLEDFDAIYQFSAQYNWQINANDYIGFSYSTNEEFDYHTITSKYFASLGEGRYFSANLSYAYADEYDDFWGLGASYYFTANTSINAGYNELETYSIGAQHYFSDNYALSASYTSNDDGDILGDHESYNLSFTAQF